MAKTAEELVTEIAELQATYNDLNSNHPSPRDQAASRSHEQRLIGTSRRLQAAQEALRQEDRLAGYIAAARPQQLEPVRNPAAAARPAQPLPVVECRAQRRIQI